MAVIGNQFLTFADWAAQYDGTKINTIVESLSQENAILQDIIVTEANELQTHRTTVRTGLPEAFWRSINAGIPTTKSTSAVSKEVAGNLESESQIDVDLLKINNDDKMFRLNEALAHVQGMSQTVASTLFYGDASIVPNQFTGLATRYNTVNPATAPIGANVLDAGGTGSDNMSMWLVTWGGQTTHGFFPKGSRAGLLHDNISDKFRVTDTNGNFYYAAIDRFKWELGLSVRDWRYNVRIANIDVSDLAGGSPVSLTNLMIKAANLLPTTGGSLSAVTKSDGNLIQGNMGRSYFYCNRTLRTFLEIQAVDKTNVLLSLQEGVSGETVLMFRGIPIHTVDALVTTEARVI